MRVGALGKAKPRGPALGPTRAFFLCVWPQPVAKRKQGLFGRASAAMAPGKVRYWQHPPASVATRVFNTGGRRVGHCLLSAAELPALLTVGDEEHDARHGAHAGVEDRCGRVQPARDRREASRPRHGLHRAEQRARIRSKGSERLSGVREGNEGTVHVRGCDAHLEQQIAREDRHLLLVAQQAARRVKHQRKV